jgi:hypothetical protein
MDRIQQLWPAPVRQSSPYQGDEKNEQIAHRGIEAERETKQSWAKQQFASHRLKASRKLLKKRRVRSHIGLNSQPGHPRSRVIQFVR